MSDLSYVRVCVLLWTLVCVPQARLRYVSAGAASLLAVALVLFLASGPGDSGGVAHTQGLEEAPVESSPASPASQLMVRLVYVGAKNVIRKRTMLALSLSLSRARRVSSCRSLAHAPLPPSARARDSSLRSSVCLVHVHALRGLPSARFAVLCVSCGGTFFIPLEPHRLERTTKPSIFTSTMENSLHWSRNI
jgi:hypothetical protein